MLRLCLPACFHPFGDTSRATYFQVGLILLLGARAMHNQARSTPLPWADIAAWLACACIVSVLCALCTSCHFPSALTHKVTSMARSAHSQASGGELAPKRGERGPLPVPYRITVSRDCMHRSDSIIRDTRARRRVVPDMSDASQKLKTPDAGLDTINVSTWVLCLLCSRVSRV